MGVERQALLLAEKASMAGEAAEALQDIETQARHHHSDEAYRQRLADKNGTREKSQVPFFYVSEPIVLLTLMASALPRQFPARLC
ncbi:hypothetical protein [Janthinobacterium sp. PC23-8]|uniref:hypothetical protein n=1 Tax=Janthinobacterium sp. PC23-8 TaxID=2012679 RepID=UPI000B96CED6|nr:hypothetical protein [Janthinobacterium sp. PC23-8]OYO31852.1 hypothetical protein CD932_12505 [Janthinobacterium sp. PC23-8]